MRCMSGGQTTSTHRRGGRRQRRLDDVDDPVDGRNVPLQQLPLVHQFTALRGKDTRSEINFIQNTFF